MGACWTKRMECIFPFKDVDGHEHNKCTMSRLCNDAEYCNNVEFLWCATKVDDSGKMTEWGKCEDSPIFRCNV